MQNAITITDDGFSDDAKENVNRAIRGTLLKCSKGRWTMGPNNDPVPPGLRLVVMESKAAWVKWWGGLPIEHIWRAPGQPLPEREDLPDGDPSLWETDADGEPKDPWQLTKYLFLVNPETAEQFTFSTTSWGGRSEINDLSEKIALMRVARPKAYPIVELATGTYTLKKRRDLGPIPKPVFRIVGWTGGTNGDPLTPALPLSDDGNEPPTTRELLDEEIPF